MRRIIAICCAVAMIALSSASVQADSTQAKSIGYAVRAILPDNQLDDQASYFDLKVKPGQTQVLQVTVMNRGDKDIEVAAEAFTSYTNPNGVIEFANRDEKDPSLAVDFAQIVKPVQPKDTEKSTDIADEYADAAILKIPAGGESIAEFDMTVPDESFEGTVLGGLMFTMLHQVENSDGSTTINNIYRYMIGVRLQEDTTPVEPVFELTGAEMVESSVPPLVLHLRNPQPLIARDITLQVSVYPSDGGEAVLEIDRSGISMAPNSTMPYIIRMSEEDRLEPGSYRVSLELRYSDESWQYETQLEVP